LNALSRTDAGTHAGDVKKAAQEIGATAWLQTVSVPAEFRYVHTVSRRRAARGASPDLGSALGGPELMPGGLPPGWSVAGQVDPAANTIEMRFQTPAGPGARAIIRSPSVTQGSSFGISIGNSDRP